MKNVFKKAQKLIYFLALSCCEQLKHDIRKSNPVLLYSFFGIIACFITYVIYLSWTNIAFHTRLSGAEVVSLSDHPAMHIINSVESLTTKLQLSSKRLMLVTEHLRSDTTLSMLNTLIEPIGTTATNLKAAAAEMMQMNNSPTLLQRIARVAHTHANVALNFYELEKSLIFEKFNARLQE